MWQTAVGIGHPVRLELTRVGFLFMVADHYTIRGACRCLILTKLKVIYKKFYHFF